MLDRKLDGTYRLAPTGLGAYIVSTSIVSYVPVRPTGLLHAAQRSAERQARKGVIDKEQKASKSALQELFDVMKESETKAKAPLA